MAFELFFQLRDGATQELRLAQENRAAIKFNSNRMCNIEGNVQVFRLTGLL